MTSRLNTSDQCSELEYVAAEIELRPLGKHRWTARCIDTGKTHVLSATDLRVLHSCLGAKQLRKHYEAVCTSTLSRQHLDVGMWRVLLRLVSRGLLTPLHAPRPKHGTTDGLDTAEPSITEIIIPTANRPEHLGALLSNLLYYQKTSERRFTVRVVDDSRRSLYAQANQRLVLEYSKHEGTSVTYVDRGCRQQLCTLLVKHLELSPRVSSALVGSLGGYRRSLGAARNISLLDTMGSRVLTIDDDVTLPTTCPSHFEFPVVLSRVRAPIKRRFFSNEYEMYSSVSGGLIDPLSMHDRYLGRTLRQLDLNLTAASDAACSTPLWASYATRRGLIKLTSPGLVGSSGRSLQSWILAGYDNRERGPLTPEAYYDIARTSSLVSEIPEALIISDNPFCMTYTLGMDNTTLLPPFLPLGRNADGVFGFLVRFMYEEGLTAFLPSAVFHNRPSAQVVTGDAVWKDSRIIKESDILLRLLKDYKLTWRSLSPPHRLEAIGKHLSSIGSMPFSDFRALIEQTVRQEFSCRIAFFEDLLLQARNMPVNYISDLTKAINVMTRSCGSAHYSLSNGKERLLLCDEGLQKLQSFIGLCGETLSVWPLVASTWNMLLANNHRPKL